MRWKRFGIWESITWAEYGANARAVGCALLERGYKRGDRVAILSDNRPEWAYADQGAQGAGLIPVGLYTTEPAAELARLLNECGARLLFVENDEQLHKALAALPEVPALDLIVYFDDRGLHAFSHAKVIGFAALLSAGRAFAERHPARWDEEVAKALPADIAAIVFTAGLTGAPKSVLLTHANLLFQQDAMARLYPGQAGDEQLSLLPLGHVLERTFALLRPFDHGAVINFGEGPAALAENLREVSPHVLLAVPRVWEKLHAAVTMAIGDATGFQKWGYRTALNIGYRLADLELSRQPVPGGLAFLHAVARFAILNRVRGMIGLRRARLALCATAPLAPSLTRWYRALGVPMAELYGQAECAGVAAGQAPADAKPGAVGKALPGTEVTLAPNGEVLVRGPHVFAGYLNRPELDAATLRDGWLHTGDTGTLDGEGHLTLTGRTADRMVTAAGHAIAPGRIESLLRASPYIAEAVLIGDGRGHLACVVAIEHEQAAKYAASRNIAFTSFASLAQAPELVALIGEEIEAVNRDAAEHERIRRFHLLDAPLAPDDAEMSPVLKLRRHLIARKHDAAIEAMYRD
jgi:long-chain acyl-CoA synthetase